MTGQWCPPPPATGQFLDQSRDDALSATFDSEPLAEPVELFGEPVVRFRLRHPGPRTLVSVKLQNVAPDGSSQPVTTAAVEPRGRGRGRARAAADGRRLAVCGRAPHPGRRGGERLAQPVAAAAGRAARDRSRAVELELPGLPGRRGRVRACRTSRWSRSPSPAPTSPGAPEWKVVTDVLTGRAGHRHLDARPRGDPGRGLVGDRVGQPLGDGGRR